MGVTLLQPYRHAVVGGGPVILRPDGTVDADFGGSGNPWFLGGSGSTLHGATSDNSDASYATAVAGSGELEIPEAGGLILSLGTHSFGGATINSVTLRVRVKSSQANSIQVYQRVSGTNSAADSPTVTGSFVTYTGATRTSKPGGGAWDQTAIDALQVLVDPILVFDGGDIVDIAEIYADVAYT